MEAVFDIDCRFPEVALAAHLATELLLALVGDLDPGSCLARLDLPELAGSSGAGPAVSQGDLKVALATELGHEVQPDPQHDFEKDTGLNHFFGMILLLGSTTWIAGLLLAWQSGLQP